MKYSIVIAVCIASVLVISVSSPAWAEDVDGHCKGSYSNTGQCRAAGR